jgi:hypothetical protein
MKPSTYLERDLDSEAARRALDFYLNPPTAKVDPDASLWILRPDITPEQAHDQAMRLLRCDHGRRIRWRPARVVSRAVVRLDAHDQHGTRAAGSRAGADGHSRNGEGTRGVTRAGSRYFSRKRKKHLTAK